MHNFTLEDFNYDLPESLIAQFPTAQRRESRLLTIPLSDPNAPIAHQRFADFEQFVQAGDLLIFNDTKVIPARLTGKKLTGGKVSALVERILSDDRALMHIRASHAPGVGSQLIFENAIEATVSSQHDGLFELQFNHDRPLLQLLEQYGDIPLPPYIARHSALEDIKRYQTVYAKHPGAVAAPTAGLHFDDDLLVQLKAKGVDCGFLTLHVGAGTFQPVRTHDLSQHIMHAERLTVDEKLCEQVAKCKAQGGRAFAIGTTVVRSLETAGQSGVLKPFSGESQLFIRPGYTFKIIDGLLTNFHLPKSTLLMLVSAFGGYKRVMSAYQEAVREKYRFFSYGDAMLLYP